jgi:hypothetical protein
MSSQAGSARSARSGEGPTGYELFWDKVIQPPRNKDFVMLSLFTVVGLLVSLYLTILLDPPAAEALLQMPL